METPEDDEERDWQELALTEFLKGYAESDDLYDVYFSHLHDASQKSCDESD